MAFDVVQSLWCQVAPPGKAYETSDGFDRRKSKNDLGFLPNMVY